MLRLPALTPGKEQQQGPSELLIQSRVSSSSSSSFTTSAIPKPTSSSFAPFSISKAMRRGGWFDGKDDIARLKDAVALKETLRRIPTVNSAEVGLSETPFPERQIQNPNISQPVVFQKKKAFRRELKSETLSLADAASKHIDPRYNPEPSSAFNTYNQDRLNKLNTCAENFVNEYESLSSRKFNPESEMHHAFIAESLLELDMLDSLDSFIIESHQFLSSSKRKRLSLHLLDYYMKKCRFDKAISLVKRLRSILPPVDLSEIKIIASIDDLVYILAKYHYIHMLRKSNIDGARTLLETEILSLVIREADKGGMRGAWFQKDFDLLQDALSSKIQGNPYLSFDFEGEVNNFWEGKDKSLYLLALQTLFLPDPSASPASEKDHIPFGILYQASQYASNAQSVLKRIYEAIQSLPTPHEESKRSPPSDSKKISSSSPVRSDNYFENDSPINLEFQVQPSVNALTEILPERPVGDGKFQANVCLPPVYAENADFAIQKVIGPSLKQVSFMTCTVVDSDVIIAASLFEEKAISLYSVKLGQTIGSLEHKGIKSTVALQFHSAYSDVLLSADISGEVRAWRWTDGQIIRSWKKLHSRLIHRIDVVPGDPDRIATCSADQTLKIVSLSRPDLIESIHANEPFTSFVFQGPVDDPNQMKIVASLPYCLKVYKLRTLALVKSIPLSDLKNAKIAITSVKAHPIHDNYLLLSVDNTLRLFDLNSGATLRVFNTREIPVGTRIEGNFSPNGTYVYACCFDKFSLVHRTIGGVNGLTTSRSDGDLSATGVFIWRIDSGKMERHLDMFGRLALGNSNRKLEHPATSSEAEDEEGDFVSIDRSTVSHSEWISYTLLDGSLEKRFVVASMDGFIRIHE